MFWKMQPFHQANRVRFVYVCLIYHLYQSFLLYVMVKNKKEKMCENWYWHVGHTNKSHPMAVRDRRFPADRKKNYVRYSNFHQVRRNKRISMIYTNWWCRDQNFRKYFEMRKKNGIRPALSGFYHEKIYDEAAAKNASIAAMRHSR